MFSDKVDDIETLSRKEDEKRAKITSIAPGVVKDRLQKSINWRNFLELPSKWAENDRFEAGEQWPPVTALTKTLPRPVYNFIKYVKKHQVSAVLNENIKMVFSNMEEEDDTTAADWGDIFSRYSETTWEELNQLKLNMQALASAHSTGIGIWHYFWDSSYEKGKYLKVKGKMDGEVLDPMNVFFGKPSELNVQKQPWIIIVKRESLDYIKKMAKQNKVSALDMERLKPDKNVQENKYANAQVEQESEDGMANLVLTYWKADDGLIYSQFTCNDVVVREARSTQFDRYPIAAMNWEERKENIYGMSGTEGLIPNQRIINMLLAMQVMSVQLSGFPKLMYKKGFVNPAKIRNLLGEMVEDLNPAGQWSAQYLNPGQVSPHANELVEGFLNYSKELTGANDTMTGDAAPDNATAINLLQKASSVALGDNKRRFYIAMEDIGRIWEQFWKIKYNTARVVTIKDDDEKDVQLAFRGSDAKDTEMKLKIDIGPSSEYNEGYTILALDKLWQMQLISGEQFIKYSPKNTMPFKDSLLRDMEKQKMEQQQQTMQQLIGTMNPQERQIFSSSDPASQQKMLINLASQEQQKLQMQPPDMTQGQQQQIGA